jgi:GTP pyrophosphokinase
MTTSKINSNFEDVLSRIREYSPKADVDGIKKAWAFAKLAHTGQKRLSGEPFVYHVLAVAEKLVEWKLDSTSIIAALLHDSIEDGGAKREDIVSEFGEEVATLVDGVTKVTTLRLKGSKESEFTENLRKMLLVMARDLRVILVKLADRMHNMETLYALPKEKQKANSIETIEVYAPLAERLGMGEVKGRLEDLAFPYLYPKKYKSLLRHSGPYFKKAKVQIEKMKKVLHKKLLEEGIRAEIQGRKKHLYSLWRKLQREEVDGDFSKVSDIIALRIIVGTVSQCYATLGIVHANYKPVPHFGVSDFIAQPKPNGYRSIHTNVFGPDGAIVEVQIRTELMHHEAEEGVAAHWAYSELKEKISAQTRDKVGTFAPTDKLSWVKQLVDWQKEMSDSKEFIEAVKFDALKHRNFIFSPRGDVYDLPVGATPVDFAYAVHTQVGHSTIGAKVDGKMVPLDFKLKSGQVVEILKSKNPKGPNNDWLQFVVTTLARREIAKYFKKSLLSARIV